MFIVVFPGMLVEWSTGAMVVILNCIVLYELRLSCQDQLHVYLYYVHSIDHHYSKCHFQRFIWLSVV